MRSLAAHTEASSRRSSQLFLYFTLFIMVVSSVGYAFLSSPSTDQPLPDASGPKGVQNQGNGVWTANVYGASFQFFTDPVVVSAVVFESNLTFAELASATLEYNVQSPGLGEALGMTLGQLVQSQPVCIGPCTEDIPERDCTTPVISWNQTAPLNRVYQRNQCVFIEGTRTAFDAWIYRLTGLA